MLADELDCVIGVDTHLDEHVLAVVASPSGVVIAQRLVRANTRGYVSALLFVCEAGNGARVWAIEGSGSYGAGLVRYLVSRGETVLETSRVPQRERRLRGKDDALDAVRTARAALASDTLALPRCGERREALRLLLIARRSAVDVRREALGQLRGVIVTAPDGLREQLRALPVGKLLARCSRLRRSSTMSTDEVATRLVLRSLAHRIQAATIEAQSSSARCSPTSAHSHRGCSTSPASGRSWPRSCSSPGHTTAASAPKPPSRASPASPRSPPPAARQRGTDSAAAATGNSTAHSTRSRCTAASTTSIVELDRELEQRTTENRAGVARAARLRRVDRGEAARRGRTDRPLRE
jgi:Transposase